MHKDTDRSTHKRPRYRMIKSRFERRAYDRKEHAKIAHPPRIAGRANLGGGVHMCIYSQSRATKIPSRAKASKRRQREHSTHSSFAIPAVSPFQPQTRLSKPHEAHQVLTTADGKGEGRFRRFGCAARFSSTRKLGVACRGQRESATQERAAVASETRSRLPETSMLRNAKDIDGDPEQAAVIDERPQQDRTHIDRYDTVNDTQNPHTTTTTTYPSRKARSRMSTACKGPTLTSETSAHLPDIAEQRQTHRRRPGLERKSVATTGPEAIRRAMTMLATPSP
ncbi:hypothetical protein DFP72DRAFT_1079821 [Ephemerocybe angulata]|uniref:Uncharacterized protein n=1 Tax=Ephemerocybe angulata TaxID=980116 RepID=A0A8H6LTV8_9AGAR|nr:hypothetical protein DFP72DRAFT_1079821 [Tulosesus angulatus]